jgi:TolB-like protein
LTELRKPEGNIPTLVLLDFASDRSIAPEWAGQLTDAARAALEKTTAFSVLDRAKAAELIGAEQFVDASLCDRTSCYVKHGRELEVDKVMHGRIGKSGSNYILTLRIIDVEKAVVEHVEANQVNAKPDGLLREIDDQVCTLIRGALSIRK